MEIPVKVDAKADAKINLTKPLCKLIDAIKNGCHLVYEPTHIRRIAKANADASIIQAKANIEIATIIEIGKRQIDSCNNIESRAQQRLLQQSIFQQENIESVIQKTINHLPQTVSNDPVEVDWLVTFFDNVKSISNEDMQTIWAKILAGEVNQPGSFSMRTLHILKQMSSNEALLFSEFCSHLVVIESTINPSFFTNTYGRHDNRFVTREFNQRERLLLAEMNLVNFEEDIFYSFEFDKLFHLTYGGKKLSIKYRGVEHRGGKIKTIICGYPLTQSGNELFNICSPRFDEKFWSNLQDQLRLLDFEIQE